MLASDRDANGVMDCEGFNVGYVPTALNTAISEPTDMTLSPCKLGACRLNSVCNRVCAATQGLRVVYTCSHLPCDIPSKPLI